MIDASIVAFLQADPRRAFAIDGVGALVSAVALGLVLPPFAVELGTTPLALYALASLPVVFALYDLACVLLHAPRWRTALRVIAAANAAYAPISMAVLIGDGVGLTVLGHAYFVGEITIVVALAILQLRTASLHGRDPLP